MALETFTTSIFMDIVYLWITWKLKTPSAFWLFFVKKLCGFCREAHEKMILKKMGNSKSTPTEQNLSKRIFWRISEACVCIWSTGWLCCHSHALLLLSDTADGCVTNTSVKMSIQQLKQMLTCIEINSVCSTLVIKDPPRMAWSNRH